MYCYIKEWPDKMATLMTEDGVVIWTFETIEEAREVWQDWYQQQAYQSQQLMSCVKLKTEGIAEPPIEIYSHPSSFTASLKKVIASCHRYFSGSRDKSNIDASFRDSI